MFDEIGLTLNTRTRRETGQEELDRAAAGLFALFGEREKEFSFNSAVVVEYPDIADTSASPLLHDPVGYFEGRIAALQHDGEPIGRTVVLTTFGDRLHAPLSTAGYSATPIDMPAGPDFTWWFEKVSGAGRTLYLEAVDEADEKIRPSFALELHDGQERLRGGACGAIHERDGSRFCYLATMTLDTGLPPATGLALGKALIDFLRFEGVNTVHLGTQTAGPFYEKLGFRITHRVLPDLRLRRTAKGSEASTDLVMMELTL